MSTFVRHVALLAAKDLRIELRSWWALGSAIALGAIGLFLASLAIGPSPDRLRSVAPAIMWLAFIYAAVVVADRLDQTDRDDDAFSALWLVLGDRRAIYAGKVVALTVVLTAVLAGLWTLSLLVLDIQLRVEAVVLIPLTALVASAVSAGACLVVAAAHGSRHRALLLPVLLLPILIPTVLAAVQASDSLIAGDQVGASRWTLLLAAQLALFLGLGLVTYEQAATPE